MITDHDKVLDIRTMSSTSGFTVKKKDDESILFYPQFFNQKFTLVQKKILNSNKLLAKVLKSLTVRVVTDIDEAESLWKSFTPNESFFDRWEFRYAFWYAHRYPVHFITLNSGSETVAVLPLWLNTDCDWYTWFGSNWQEDNTFFVADPIFIPLLLAAAPKPIELCCILPSATKPVSKLVSLTPDYPKYVLDLGDSENFTQFISRYAKKRRYNFRRDVNKIEALKPKIIFNDYTHFDDLINLITRRKKSIGEEEIYWSDKRKVETFKYFIQRYKNNESFSIRMASALVGGKVAATDLIVTHKGVYTALVGGNDLQNFSGIGTYMNYLNIIDAINLGIRTIDFLQDDFGWKGHWCKSLPLDTLYVEV